MKICSVNGCSEVYYCKGYCQRHWGQIRRHGEISDNIKRNRRLKNEIIIESLICKMKLYNNEGLEIAETLFDLKYKEEIEKFKWHLSDHGYVKCNWFDENKKHKMMFLHSAIIYLSNQEVPDGYEIDHKDTNKLNNLEINLRICTRPQNQQNTNIRSNNSSGFKGVAWSNHNKNWLAKLKINNKEIFLGYFTNEKDAAIAYNKAAIQHFGEFARINEI